MLMVDTRGTPSCRGHMLNWICSYILCICMQYNLCFSYSEGCSLYNTVLQLVWEFLGMEISSCSLTSETYDSSYKSLLQCRAAAASPHHHCSCCSSWWEMCVMLTLAVLIVLNMNLIFPHFHPLLSCYHIVNLPGTPVFLVCLCRKLLLCAWTSNLTMMIIVMRMMRLLVWWHIKNDSAVCVVDNGRINFADFCKLMKQQKYMPGDETRLPEQETRHVFRVILTSFVI